MSNLIKTYPNSQTIIDRQYQEKTSSSSLYHTYTLNSLENAAVTFSDKEYIKSLGIKNKKGNIISSNSCVFQLWIYISRNAEDFKFALSFADFKRFWNCDRETFDNAVKILKMAGFLVLKPNTKTHYIFYENPKKYNNIIETQIENIETPIETNKEKEIEIAAVESTSTKEINTDLKRIVEIKSPTPKKTIQRKQKKDIFIF